MPGMPAHGSTHAAPAATPFCCIDVQRFSRMRPYAKHAGGGKRLFIGESSTGLVRAVLLAACVVSTTAQAQSVGPDTAPLAVLERLTLPQAEELFARRNRELQLARRATEAAEADVVAASARPNPTLSINPANVSASARSSGSWDRNFNTVVGVSRLFERGGKRELRTQAAQYGLLASRSEESDTERQQRASLYNAFYDLKMAEDKVRLALDTADLFGKSLDAANLRLKAGDIASVDVTRITVDASRAQNDARAARGGQERAQFTLAYLLGAEPQARRIHTAQDWPALAPVEQGDSARIVEGRADVQAARARVQAAEKNRDLAQALRTRDVVGGITYDRFGDFRNDSVGVTLSVPLFTSYYYEGEIRRAEVELLAAQQQLERMQAAAATEIGQAISDLNASSEQLQRIRQETIVAAQKAADAAEFAFSNGSLGVMDLLDARRQLYAARLSAISAQSDYAKALTAWRAATQQAPARPGAAMNDPGS